MVRWPYWAALTTVIILILTYPSSGLTEQHCGPQDYDSEAAPNFDCPGPGERELTPDLNPPAPVPVHQGREVVAEWAGALVHRDMLLEVGFALKAARRLRWADRLRLREESAIHIRYLEQVAAARQNFAEQQRDIYRARSQQAEARAQSLNSWWRSPALWFAVGVITAGILVVATGYGLSAIGG